MADMHVSEIAPDSWQISILGIARRKNYSSKYILAFTVII